MVMAAGPMRQCVAMLPFTSDADRNAQRARFRVRPILALLTLTLLIGCKDDRALPPASTQWKKWSESVEAVFYYDPATITKNGNLRRVWEVQDLKKPDEFFGARSRRLLTEYDCTVARTRHLYIGAYTEPLAGGEILVASEQAGAWRSIPSKTSDAAMLIIACDNR
jgi:Surface-adhesin protein E